MFEHLSWDSDFFNIKIAKIYIDAQMSEKDFNNSLNVLKSNSYSLAYVFLNESNYKSNKINYLDDSKIIDKKVTFIKNITVEDFDYDTNLLQNVKSALFQKLNDDILSITYQTGEFSRFKIDSKLPTGSFEHLYKTWIQKSINKEIADEVIIINNNENKIIGLITLKIKKKTGEIGLIGVDFNNRGEGIGSKLIKLCQNYFLNNNINIIEVTTQKNNVNACKFYLKNSFEIKQVDYIYHYWL